ncbi:MAG: Rrf2 family transcriptional regulator [Bacteroidetes bacterium]|nr:Rrf2 family transcriptional regulator [Bacteroidota bacterium]
MLSKKTKYAINALVHLAKEPPKQPVLISDISEKQHIPKKFLEAILLELKKHGILKSKKGKGGGYSLSKPPSEIEMGQIIRILSGPLAPVACVSQTAYRKCDECRDENCCGIRIVMKEVRDAIANILDKTSLEDVIQKTESKNLAMNLNYHI